MFEGQDVGGDADDETAYGVRLGAAYDEEIELQVVDLHVVVDPRQRGPLVGSTRGTHTEAHGVVVDHAIYWVGVVVVCGPRVALVPAGADVINMVTVSVCLEILGVGQVVVSERVAFGPYAAPQPGAGCSPTLGGDGKIVHCVFRKTRKGIESVGNPSDCIVVQYDGETAAPVAFPVQRHLVVRGDGCQVGRRLAPLVGQTDIVEKRTEL